MFNAINAETSKSVAEADHPPPPKKPKRSTVPAACQSCRAHKLKCEQVRPCRQCVRKQIECVSLTQENETQRQANDRQNQALAKEVASLKSLFNKIALETDEDKAHEMFSLIRRRHSPETVLRMSTSITDTGLHESYLQDLRLKFLLAAAQSNASLDVLAELIDTAFDDDAKVQLPNREQFGALKGRMITVVALEDMLRAANEQTAVSDVAHVEREPQVPPFRVPCRPWTVMIDSDEEMSQFFSVYLCWLNPMYQFVEEDSILKSLRSKDLSSQYCSQFLVHAVLALTSLFCEYDKAFAEPGKYFNRGEHFLQEALRLWDLEAESPSIPNIQALLISSFSLAYLGSSSKGIMLMTTAVEMSKKVDYNQHIMAGSQRVVASVQQAIVFADVGVRTTYRMRTTVPKPIYDSHTALSDFIPDETRQWRPFPYRQTYYAYNLRTLVKHREELMLFMYEVNTAVVEARAATAGFMTKTADLVARFRAWMGSLPPNLIYSIDLPSFYFELHAYYVSYQLMLHEAMEDYLTTTMTEAASLQKSIEVHGEALQFALQAAVILRDYGKAFGHKCVLGVMVPLASTASFRLLKQLRIQYDKDGGASSAEDTKNISERPFEITDPAAALEECFRSLLAVSLQQALPMRIAQAVYNAALDMRVYLPKNVLTVLTVLIKPVIQPLADSKIDSLYPYYALSAKEDVEAAAATLLKISARDDD